MCQTDQREIAELAENIGRQVTGRLRELVEWETAERVAEAVERAILDTASEE